MSNDEEVLEFLAATEGGDWYVDSDGNYTSTDGMETFTMLELQEMMR